MKKKRLEERYYTYKETAEKLRISVFTVKKWVREGKLKPKRIGYKTALIPENQLIDLME